jgi:hypothetical protein
MAKVRPARAGKKNAAAAQVARGLPCLMLVLGSIVLLGLMFYLLMKG